MKALHVANAINQQNKSPVHLNRNKLNGGVQRLINKHKMLFSPEVGNLRHITARFTLKPNFVTKFVRGRAVPFSLREEASDGKSDKLDRLENQGIISKVTHSEWESPLLCPRKIVM